MIARLAYAARYVAKNIVAAGIADRFEIQVSYAIGVAHPTSIAVETFGTVQHLGGRLLGVVRPAFRPATRCDHRDLKLSRPIYRPTAAYGHFGRDDIDAPWEMTHRADALRADAPVRTQAPLLIQRLCRGPRLDEPC